MNNQQSSDVTSRNKKRAQFEGPQRSKSKAGFVIALVVMAVAAVAVYFAIGASKEAPTTIANTPTPDNAASANEVRVSIADVSSGRAKFFDYKLPDNQQVRFFVVKSSEGDYRAALDACEVCAHAKKGYRQEGDDMVCNNCNKRFATALIGKISGGCHPVGIASVNDGSNIVVKKSDLAAGAKYF